MIRRLGLYLAVLGLSLPSVEAQTALSKASKQGAEHTYCNVVRTQKALPRAWNEDLRSFPSYPSRTSDRDLIYKTEHISVFRLAMAISQISYRTDFSGQKSKVYDFWNEMETYLNKIYVRDCGIRFEVVRDDRLILNIDAPAALVGTSIVNEAIGTESYDVGLVIKGGNFGGQAILGGILYPDSKAAVYTRKNPETIAHELGHLFGAEHTHSGNTGIDGEYVEPGRGQSMMSYNTNPRTFFALSSVQSIRNALRTLGYYTDKSRTTKSREGIVAHAPYIEPLTNPKPELLHSRIRAEYVVTKGTRFQFYIPTKESSDKWFYHAHSYDPVKGSIKTYTNALQPAYAASRAGVVMFHPRYDFPVGGMESISDRLIPYSDSYRNGLYTFMLSAFNGEGYHDTRSVKLRIVDGEEFKITKFEGPGRLTDEAIAGQSTLSLQWQPCHKLYGQDSKVRILLSADFGETFPYILADNEPNDGSWQGVCPYIEVGRVSKEFFQKQIRGAVLKVEVIGEAAYALTHEQHYKVQGRNTSPIPTGGFLIKKPTDGIQFPSAPPITVHYESRAEVPTMPTLRATYRSSSTDVVGEETQQGNSLIRRWRAVLDGKTATYTQVITWQAAEDEAQQLRAKLEALRPKAQELYKHLGELAYPRRDTPLSQAFVRAYDAVFTSQGTMREGATEAGYEALKQAFEAMATLPDKDITLPVSGAKYKIANFQIIFGQEHLYYLRGERGNSATTSQNIDDATVWDCVIEGNLCTFTSEGHSLNINGFNRSDTHIALLRGYTWGAFSLVGLWEATQPRIAYYLPGGTLPHFTDITDRNLIQEYKNNQAGYLSTDFRLFLVGELPNTPPSTPPNIPPPTPKSYSLSLVQSQGGVLRIEHSDLSNVAEGTQITVLVTPNQGYELQSLHAGTEDITETRQFVVRQNTEVKAVFRLKTFRVTLQQTQGGVIRVKNHSDLSSIPYGTELVFEAHHTEGYRLKRLYSGSVDFTSNLRLRIEDNHDVQAEWERLPEPPTPPKPPSPPTKPKDNVDDQEVNDTQEQSTPSPKAWRGYIYDLTGLIVGKGNFGQLPPGIYILGGKKYIKR